MRLFVAINLPPAVRDALWGATAPLRALELPLKWVAPSGLHLTLKFLGEVSDEQGPAVDEALAQAAGTGPPRPIPLTINEFGTFPGAGPPRIVWVGIASEPALELLQHRLEEAYAPLGFAPEGRPFRPHITLARAANRRGGGGGGGRRWDALAEALGAVAFTETVAVETVELMRSTPQAGGSVYQVRRSVRLA